MSIARLCLGTAGLTIPNYPVGSVSHPTHADVEAILRRAEALGIRWFDAASAYGSEDWLLHATKNAHRVTKLCPALVRLNAKKLIRDWDLVLLHNPTVADLRDPDVIGWLKLSRPGKWGASVYTTDEARAAIDAGASVLQVPYCILNASHDVLLREAKADGVTVFARQPFLQGLLTNIEPHDSDSVDAQLGRRGGLPSGLRLRTLRKVRAVCRRHRVSRVEACLRFSLETPADYVCFGAGSVAHLEEVCAIASRPAPDNWPTCYAALRELSASVPPIGLGSLWSQP